MTGMSDDAGTAYKVKERRGYRSLKAIDPKDGGKWDVLLSDERMASIAKRGRGPALELGYSVPSVLLRPTAIFQGLRSEQEREWLCYCGRPSRAFDLKTGLEGPPWEGELLLVFVNFPDRIAYQHSWFQCDPASANLPIDHETRFYTRLL